MKHILITGGAGYIGSLLTGVLLSNGYQVSVLDSLLFGGDSLLNYLSHPNFSFTKVDVWEANALRDAFKSKPAPDAVIHLAAIVGFPACQTVGRQVAWRYNVEATQHVFREAEQGGAKRFIFTSTYSNYGQSPGGALVTEESPLNPQSLYAETKIAAEEFLLSQKNSECIPTIFRLATLFGISPRTRFDLIVNQFVLDAYTKHELLIYQRGYSRSFVHVRDVIAGFLIGLAAPEGKVRGQIYNLGSENGNYSKDRIVEIILKHLPETTVTYKDLTFGGDMRDINVSFEKIRRELDFKALVSVEDGVKEVLQAIKDGLIRNPHDERFRNAQFIVQ